MRAVLETSRPNAYAPKAGMGSVIRQTAYGTEMREASVQNDSLRPVSEGHVAT